MWLIDGLWHQLLTDGLSMSNQLISHWLLVMIKTFVAYRFSYGWHWWLINVIDNSLILLITHWLAIDYSSILLTEFIGIQDLPIIYYNVWAININVKDETECSFFCVSVSLINAINDYRKQNKLWPNGPLGSYADLT